MGGCSVEVLVVADDLVAGELVAEIPRPQAVFKHAILSTYPVVFASRWGSSWPVVFLDGDAGRGEYGDGTPGSPVRLSRSANRFGATRDVRGIYVERDPDDFANLRRVLTRYGRPADRVVCGSVSDHLPAILKSAAGSALFAFLDPLRTGLSREQFAGSLLGRAGRAPMEVVLHLGLDAVARMGALLRTRLAGAPLSEADVAAIEETDRFLGGIWWQQHFLPVLDTAHEQATAAALRVTQRYLQGICLQTGFRGVCLPVRRLPERQPEHVLVHFSRHRDGLWRFADVLGRAGLEWRRAWRAEEEGARLAAVRRRHPEPGLFDLEAVLAPRPFDSEAYLARSGPAWQRVIAENIERLLAAANGHSLVLADRVDRVYGTVLGAASDRHVRAAVSALHSAGRIDHDGKSRGYHKDLIRLRPSDRGGSRRADPNPLAPRA